MKKNNFIFQILILFSGLLYALGGSAAAFLISGTAVSVSVFRKRYTGASVFAAIALIICFLASPDIALSFLLGGILPGVFIGIGMTYKWSLQTLMVAPSLSVIGNWAYAFFSYKAQTGKNPFEEAVDLVSENVTSMLGEISAASQTPVDGEKIEAVGKMLDSFKSTSLSVVPATIIIASCLLAFCIIELSKNIVFKGSVPYLRSFSEIYVSGGMVFALLVSGGITLFSGIESLKLFCLNVLLIVFTYYSVCGLSVVDFFLKRKIFSKLLRCVIYVAVYTMLLLAVSPVAISVMLILGAADMVFDFRRIRPLPPVNDDEDF